MTPLRLAAMFCALAALVASTVQRRGAGKFPLAILFREKFPAPAGLHKALWLAFAAGTVQVLLPVLIYSSYGWVEIITPNNGPLTFPGLAAATVVIKLLWVAAEEIIFRGALLEKIERRTNLLTAILLSSLLFGLGHLGRAGTDFDSFSLAVWALDGIGFCAAYIATSSLWAPTLWHLAKNLWIWLIVGGGTLQLVPGFMELRFISPTVWTGAADKAGAVDLLVTAMIVMLAAGMALRRKRAVLP